MFREERGSALLLVLFMVLIFSILGLAVLSASIGGATRTETKQKDVQSLHLAEKALNEAAAYIMSDFQSQDGVNIDEVQQRLDDIKVQLNGRTISTSLDVDVGAARGEIHNISFKKNDKDDSSLNYEITIEAEATVNNVTRRLTQVLTLDTFPDSLKYAMGSEGNVLINGSPYIIGDIYAGETLKVKNEAEYLYLGTPLYQSTKFPKLEGNAYVQKSATGDGLNAYYCESVSSTFSQTSPQCDTIENVGNSNSDYKSISEEEGVGVKTIKDVLTSTDSANIHVKDQSKFAGIEVNEAFVDKMVQAIGKDTAAPDVQRTNVKTAMASRDSLTDYLRPWMEIIEPLPEVAPDPADAVAYAAYETKKSNLAGLFSSELENSMLYNGNLTIDGGEIFSQLLYTESSKHPTKLNLNKSSWIIVNGDLTINNTSLDKSSIDIRANILVTGNLSIHNAVNMDSTIYTLGKTEIVDASIFGLDKKELVLISKGAIDIYRVNSFRDIKEPFKYNSNEPGNPPVVTHGDNPPILNAFFYTDSDATIYGVGSVFWVYGGFFAKGNLTVNAIRGKATGQVESIEMEDQTQIASENQSRLIIDYNSQIFENQKVGLPRVSKVGLTVGKKKQVTKFAS
jgi:Tfp pilus assembly protein PilX